MNGKKKGIIIIIGVLGIAMILGVYLTRSSEVKYVSIQDPEDYFIIDGENYTRYAGKEDEIETGTIAMSEDESTISFINSETNESKTYDYEKGFFGYDLFEVEKANVFDGGKRFKFKTNYGVGEISVYGMSFNVSFDIEMDINGSFAGYDYWNESSRVGVYEVKNNIVTFTGIERTDKGKTKDYEATWYYNNYKFYNVAFVRQ